MNDVLASTPALAPVLVPVLAALAGAALGGVFFGGLWWTARLGAASRRPALWFFGSLLLRMGIALAGFYVVADGRWERMLTCLGGFLVARALITWLTRLPRQPEAPAPQGANRAP